MIASLKSLIGISVQGPDAEIGPVVDFYYDDAEWFVRYLAVDTGSWQADQRALLATAVVEDVEWEDHRIAVNLTRERVQGSPLLDQDTTPTLSHQRALHAYYDWPEYWSPGLTPSTAMPDLASVPLIEMAADVAESIGETMDGNRSDLRSLKETSGFIRVQGLDGDIGHVDDFIVDQSWQVLYILIDTSFWEGGKRALISPEWVDRMGWVAGNLYVNISRDTVKNSPELQPELPLDRDSLARLYEYYQQHRADPPLHLDE